MMGRQGGKSLGRLSRVLGLVVVLVGLLMVAGRPMPVEAAANAYCSGESLAVGANWSVCWEIRANEGLAITHAFYTNPNTGFDRRVLADATVAQIFVPYETGQPRYHDVAYGLGPAMQRLDAQSDCPGGTRLAGNRVCRQVEDRGLASRFCLDGSCRVRRGRALLLWASIQTGAYNYIQQWAFLDDGTIEPAIGLTGALQFGNTAHTHNVYWRMDFDIGDAGNDRVEEFGRIPRAGTNGLAGISTWNPLQGETYRPHDLFTFRKWRVSDTVQRNSQGKRWSYEIKPEPGDGSLRTNTDEAFLFGELWATRARSGERFVSTDEADLLSTYIDGEPLDGQDVVLWYVAHEYHEVRSEDAPYMPIEWVSFEAKPRDFFDDDPID